MNLIIQKCSVTLKVFSLFVTYGTNLRSLVMVCVAFRVFHAMNGRRKDGVLDFDDPSAECLNALDLARHFISELPYALLHPD